MGIFEDRTVLPWRVPVWFMRQAGRYHDHYQQLKKSHSFMELCKSPELAKEVTLGPIEAFDFDAAILFSDLLFPLEQLGLGLKYSPGPQLAVHVNESNISSLKPLSPAEDFYQFQGKALALLRPSLPPQKSLLGFVGGPFTLYTYAVEGGHAGSLVQAKKGLYSGLYEKFLDLLLPELISNMIVQAQGGADGLCLFDTAAGELSLKDFKNYLLPPLRRITKAFKAQFPHKKIVYYSKQTHLDYLLAIEDDHIDALGFDWRVNLPEAFRQLSHNYYLQGNFDPSWAHLPWEQCQENLLDLIQQVEDKYWAKWIFGAGHGITVKTPMENIRKIVLFIHQHFS